MVLNKDVGVKNYGTDRYDRTLGVVYVEDKNVNLEMVRAGLAGSIEESPPPDSTIDPIRRRRMRPGRPAKACGRLGIST